MNNDLNRLQPYPFEKLAALKAGISPPDDLAPIALSIGEPQHAPPEHVLKSFADNLHRLSNYPATKGLLPLRRSEERRVGKSVDQRGGSNNTTTQKRERTGT